MACDSCHTLDLRGNNIEDKMGGLIVRIIQSQTEKRDGVIWAYGLRDEYPKNIDKTGLKSIILRRNKLGKNFMRSLTRWAKYDDYLRHMDLSYNKISADPLKQFLTTLNSNNSLVSIELRGNSGFTDKIQKKVAFILLRNIEYCKDNSKFINHSWLKKDIYDIEISEAMMAKIQEQNQLINNNININTHSNKDFLGRIDVCLNTEKVRTILKSTKNNTKKLKSKNDDTQTLPTNVSTNKSVNRSATKRSINHSRYALKLYL